MDTPLVSIIIPLYNAENYLSDSIKSALKQNYYNTEIIIVNDGSTDRSLEIARKFESEKVSIISQENKGASAARNRGLSVCKGSFIQFLDADDILSADKISTQMKLLVKNPTKIAVSRTVHFFDGCLDPGTLADVDDEPHLNTHDPVEFLIDLLGGNNGRGAMVQPNAWLTPKILIDKAGLWNENLSLDDDGEFFARVILKSDGILRAESGKNYYRKFNNRTNLSAQKTHDALLSWLNSTYSKRDNLLGVIDSPRARFALYKQFLDIGIAAYPNYRDISHRALKELKDLGKFDYLPSMGGRVINTIAKIFGWRCAKKVSYLKSRYL